MGKINVHTKTHTILNTKFKNAQELLAVITYLDSPIPVGISFSAHYTFLVFYSPKLQVNIFPFKLKKETLFRDMKR